MSIRAEIARTILNTWTKQIEYRRRFGDFRGRVYVYASGKEGGKVTGFFDVKHVITTKLHKALNAEEWDLLDRLDQKNHEQFFLAKNCNDKMNMLFIENPRRLVKPLTLEEFGKEAGAAIVRAPQSWQYITVNENFSPESYEVAPSYGSTEFTADDGDPTDEFLKEHKDE
jgi:predicted transcriptional regulator